MDAHNFYSTFFLLDFINKKYLKVLKIIIHK